MLARRAVPVIVITLVAGLCWAAPPSAEEILTHALSLHKDIQDYTATVSVSFNVPGLNIPDRTAKVYVKLPDKVHVESKGIVVLPKDALLFGNLAARIKEGARVVLAGSDDSNDPPVYCLKIIPKDQDDRMRALMWIEGDTWNIKTTELWNGPNLGLQIKWHHIKVGEQYWMPSRLICSIPGGVIGESEPGIITVTFGNYVINTGLSDEFFGQKGRR